MKHLMWFDYVAAAIAVVLLTAMFALAHPVDREDAEPLASLGFDDAIFKEAHDAYWHCRRNLQTEIINTYVSCVAAVNEHHRARGWPTVTGYDTIVNYWKVIPAHPVIDAALANGFDAGTGKYFVFISGGQPVPGPIRMQMAEAQLAACEATKIEFGSHITACNAYLRSLR